MGASARRLCPISSPSPSFVTFGSSRKQCVCQQVARTIQFAPISLFPALSAQQAGRAHRRMSVPPCRDVLPLRNFSGSSGFSRTLKTSRWRSTCGWNAAHKDDQAATRSKSYMDLEMEIFQFMENSSSPDTFPSKDDLIQAGRSDLVNAIQLQGGWLAIGWDDAEDETLLTSSEFLATEFSSPGNTPALNSFVGGNSYNWPSKSPSVNSSSDANGLVLDDLTADESNSQDIGRTPTTTVESNGLEDEGFATARPLAGLKGVDFSRGRRGSDAVDSVRKTPAQTSSTVLSQLDEVINNLLKSLGLGSDARADSVHKSRTEALEREHVEKGPFDAWDDLGLGEGKQDSGLAGGKQESGSGEDKQENGLGEGRQDSGLAGGKQESGSDEDKQENIFGEGKQDWGLAGGIQESGSDEDKQENGFGEGKQDSGLAGGIQESGSDEDKQENGFGGGKLEQADGSHTDIPSLDEVPKADPLSSRKQDLGLADGKQESGSDEDKQENGFGRGKLETADGSHTDVPSPDEIPEADPLSSRSSLAEERDLHSSGESSSAPSTQLDVAAEELLGDITSGETVAPLLDDRTDEESDSPMEDPTQPGLETESLGSRRSSSGAEINAESSPEFNVGDERAGGGAEGGAEDEAEAAASPGDAVPPESEMGGSDGSPQAEAAASPGNRVPPESETGGSDASPQEHGPSRGSPEAGASGSMPSRKR
jgi:hypothetical protein